MHETREATSPHVTMCDFTEISCFLLCYVCLFVCLLDFIHNLAKRQCIRGDVAMSKTHNPPFNRHPFTTMAQCLGEIAFYAMMWPNYPAFRVTPGMKDELARGRWAGECIDLARVNSEAFDRSGELAEWKDMTEVFVEVAFASQRDRW